jgi:hypothetical protein
MALRFKPNFSKKDIRDFIRSKVQVIENILLDRLKQCGEQFVADARSTSTYTDRTRNLRGSIGYVILKDGTEIFGNFEGVSTGQATAQKFIRSVKGDYPRGFVLIVVAGMNYAAAVESKGFDVITGSSQTAETGIQRSFDRLKQSLKKAA